MRETKIVNWEKDTAEFEAYLRERENAKATIEKYMKDIRTFEKYMAGEERLDKGRLLLYKEWLADLLGHSSLDVTRIYTCDGLEEWRKSLEKLDLIEG